jgi:hypothetical protein
MSKSESEPEPDFKLLYEQKLYENDLLKKEVEILTDHLKKYTAPTRSKKYYENHREELIEKSKDYNKTHKRTIDPEKIKEYNKRSYQNRKLKNQLNENS